MFLRPEFGKAKVLIVDDDLLGAQEVANAVTELGHEVVIATQWSDAVRKFGEEIDLVLMDAVMPIVDGFKLTKVLRRRAVSYVPILFVTGLHDADAKARGMTVGADDFLTKPVEPIELQVRISAMLRIRRLTQDLEAERRGYQQLAEIDLLTGIPNRRCYESRLVTELAYAKQTRRPLSLLVLDIDHFKQVNDSFGHTAGDRLLALMGALLQDEIRRFDLAFRYGGEEFVVLARDTNNSQAWAMAERLRAAFEGRSQSAAAGRQTCSLGIATWTPEDDGIDLFEVADRNLYSAKQAGRNQVIGGTPPDREASSAAPLRILR